MLDWGVISLVGMVPGDMPSAEPCRVDSWDSCGIVSWHESPPLGDEKMEGVKLHVRIKANIQVLLLKCQKG